MSAPATATQRAVCHGYPSREDAAWWRDARAYITRWASGAGSAVPSVVAADTCGARSRIGERVGRLPRPRDASNGAGDSSASVAMSASIVALVGCGARSRIKIGVGPPPGGGVGRLRRAVDFLLLGAGNSPALVASVALAGCGSAGVRITVAVGSPPVGGGRGGVGVGRLRRAVDFFFGGAGESRASVPLGTSTIALAGCGSAGVRIAVAPFRPPADAALAR